MSKAFTPTAAKPGVITANDLREGHNVWMCEDGWTADPAHATLFEDEAIADLALMQGAAAGRVEAAPHFSGSALSFSVAGAEAVIDAASGMISIPTGALLAAGVVLAGCGARRSLVPLVALLGMALPWLVAGALSPSGGTSDPGGVAAFAARAEN